MSDENLVNGELLEDGVVVAVNNSDVFGLVNSELINPVLLLDDIDLINHFFCLDDNYKTFSINDKFSDVVLKVNDERFHVHKVVLASRSKYFRALLCGGFKESHQSEVEIFEVSENIVKIFLDYIYSGKLNMNMFKADIILEILIFSNLFCFERLERPLVHYLYFNINENNACSVFSAARLYQYEDLVTRAIEFTDNNALEVIQSEGFLSLPSEDLKEILIRDSLFVYELDIFQAVCRWIMFSPCNEDTESKIKVLSTIRYSLMTKEELLSVVSKSHLVSLDTIMDAIQLKNTVPLHELKLRARLRPDINICHPSEGFELITGNIGPTYLKSNFHNHTICIDSDSFTEENECITIKLDHPSIINYIEIQLCDMDYWPHTYYIEVSVDQQNWIRIINYEDYYCRSKQSLWIHSQVVQFVRIVGDSIGCFFVFHLKIMYKTYGMDLIEIKERGILSPKFNVACYAKNAAIIGEGCNNSSKSKSFNSCINGNWEKGFTSHYLGSGHIVIQLAQPYMLSSMRMLLWNETNCHYSYYIEVSVNMLNWEMIVDNRKKRQQSWQLFRFDPRPVTFIRITGVYSTTKKKLFRCVHVEAPAQILCDDDPIPKKTEVKQEISILQDKNKTEQLTIT